MTRLTRLNVLILFVCLFTPLPRVSHAQAPAKSDRQGLHALMPVPASVAVEEGGLEVDSRFSVVFSGYKNARLEAAAERMTQQIARQTGVPILGKGGIPVLTVTCARPAPRPVQRAVEDESYTLKVSGSGATLTAPTPYGVLRGFATFAQLVRQSPTGYVISSATIEDRPRFPWRGLLIDACRHWMPAEVIKRNLDAMAAVKLNVLHWHLSEDQGFRVESKRYPKLHGLGSDGRYYTQAEVREVVRYAADRGIRVVPEFDIPGHTGAWLVGYPELAAGPGPFEIQRRWGVFDPVLDPTREQVYVFLDRVLGEMAALFPDAYFHIGGDEVNGKQWAANPKIQAFMKRRRLATKEALHTYFNKRIVGILARHGKKVVGWDEILQPDLPKDIVVQSWRGQKSLADAARSGYQGILSNGYYLDYMWPAGRHYLVDPLGKEAADLPDEAKARILGGEACMWAEWVSPETIDSRIWPRAAAIAERYWSPAGTTDVADMYRRLAVVSRHLDFTGIRHRTAYVPMLERMADARPADALQGIVDLLEPVREYNRGRGLNQGSLTPLTRVIDAARPESEEARRFSLMVDGLLADPGRKANREAIVQALQGWKDDATEVQPLLDTFLLQEAVPLVTRASDVAAVGLRAMQALDQGTPLQLTPRESLVLAEAGKPLAEVLLMIVPAVQRLVGAAAEK